jgi:hypothetical protein
MKINIISYYNGIAFGFDIDFSEKKLFIAFLFWGFEFKILK